MKRKGTKYPSSYISAVTDEERAKIRSLVIDKIERGIKNNFGFIDGDYFAYAQDEDVCLGSISEVVNKAVKILDEEVLPEDPEAINDLDWIQDEIISAGCMTWVSNGSKIVKFFRDHNKLDIIPDWWFD